MPERGLPDGYVACQCCSWAGPRERFVKHMKERHGITPENAKVNHTEGLLRAGPPSPKPVINVIQANVKSKIKAMNKTEQRCMATLRDYCGDDVVILPQCLVLPLEGGGTYRPDFMVMNPAGPRVRLIEVKGGYKGPGWEQGIERYRRARQQWGQKFAFEMWTWDRKAKTWKVEP